MATFGDDSGRPPVPPPPSGSAPPSPSPVRSAPGTPQGSPASFEHHVHRTSFVNLSALASPRNGNDDRKTNWSDYVDESGGVSPSRSPGRLPSRDGEGGESSEWILSGRWWNRPPPPAGSACGSVRVTDPRPLLPPAMPDLLGEGEGKGVGETPFATPSEAAEEEEDPLLLTGTAAVASGPAASPSAETARPHGTGHRGGPGAAGGGPGSSVVGFGSERSAIRAARQNFSERGAGSRPSSTTTPVPSPGRRSATPHPPADSGGGPLGAPSRFQGEAAKTSSGSSVSASSVSGSVGSKRSVGSRSRSSRSSSKISASGSVGSSRSAGSRLRLSGSSSGRDTAPLPPVGRHPSPASESGIPPSYFPCTKQQESRARADDDATAVTVPDRYDGAGGTDDGCSERMSELSSVAGDLEAANKVAAAANGPLSNFSMWRGSNGSGRERISGSRASEDDSVGSLWSSVRGDANGAHDEEEELPPPSKRRRCAFLLLALLAIVVTVIGVVAAANDDRDVVKVANVGPILPGDVDESDGEAGSVAGVGVGAIGETKDPTSEPTTTEPTLSPTLSPTTAAPTLSPTDPPTLDPTDGPTLPPTLSPTDPPTANPTGVPTLGPTLSPSSPPTPSPTGPPTPDPTDGPTERDEEESSSTLDWLLAILMRHSPYPQRLVDEEKVDNAPRRAYLWLASDPLVRTYPEGRVVQRWPLATAYYALSDPGFWDGWHESHYDECRWDGIWCGIGRSVVEDEDEDEEEGGGGTGRGGDAGTGAGRGGAGEDLMGREEDADGNAIDIYHGREEDADGVTVGVSHNLGEEDANGITVSISHDQGGEKTDIFTFGSAPVDARNKEDGDDSAEPEGTEPDFSTRHFWEWWSDSSSSEDGDKDMDRGKKWGVVTEIYASFAFLSGTIPEEISVLRDLRSANLHGNSFLSEGFTGTIPTELGLLRELEYLNLSSNNLSGRVPTELGSIPHLYDLRLARNSLTGTMPEEVCARETMCYLSADCDEVACDFGCCSRCCTDGWLCCNEAGFCFF